MPSIRYEEECEAEIAELRKEFSKAKEAAIWWEGSSKLFQKKADDLERKLAESRRLYEELRRIIDGGSESMTHEDAIHALHYNEQELALPVSARLNEIEAQERKAFEAGAEWRQERGIEGWFGRQMQDAFNSYLATQAAEKEREG